MRNIKIGGYEQISKAKARKLFNDGIDILVVPCKVNPINKWGIGATLSKKADYNSISDNMADYFQYEVNSMIYYTCNSELGYYVSFYKKGE
jgi:hypothetical protein